MCGMCDMFVCKGGDKTFLEFSLRAKNSISLSDALSHPCRLCIVVVVVVVVVGRILA